MRKIILGLIIVIIVAFTVKKLHPSNLYYLTCENACKPAGCTDFNTGTYCDLPADFCTGYYKNSACTGPHGDGFVPNAQ